METVLRAASIYFFLLVVFRLSGKRTMANVTTFDFVLLLIIAETTQQGLIGDDFSVTNAAILITTLIGIDIGLSLLQRRSPLLAKLVEGEPVVLVRDGELLEGPMRRARVSTSDILEAAREHQGLARLEQVRHAVLERGGGISIVPMDGGG